MAPPEARPGRGRGPRPRETRAAQVAVLLLPLARSSASSSSPRNRPATTLAGAAEERPDALRHAGQDAPPFLLAGRTDGGGQVRAEEQLVAGLPRLGAQPSARMRPVAGSMERSTTERGRSQGSGGARSWMARIISPQTGAARSPPWRHDYGAGPVEADPDAGHQLGGVADEPDVVAVVRRAGLAGGGPVEPDLSHARPVPRSTASRNRSVTR
jgi:hypothetical protein